MRVTGYIYHQLHNEALAEAMHNKRGFSLWRPRNGYNWHNIPASQDERRKTQDILHHTARVFPRLNHSAF